MPMEIINILAGTTRRYEIVKNTEKRNAVKEKIEEGRGKGRGKEKERGESRRRRRKS
jgi:hypothetical protein